MAGALEKPITYFFPPFSSGPQAEDLSPKEKELVSLFRQLGHEALENVAMGQLRTLVEAADQTTRKQLWEDAKKDAEERGIELP